MRALACCVAACVLLPPAGHAQPSAGASTLALRLALLGAASTVRVGEPLVLNVGGVAAKPGQRAIVIRERVAVRLEGHGGPARVSVALAEDLPGATVRLDGQPVTNLPRLVDPAQRVGSTVVHQLEISIASEAPAGAFLSNLQWTAETD